MNIEYSNSMVQWDYNGQKKLYKQSNIEFANYENDYIEILAYDGDEFVYTYLNLEGNRVLSYAEGNDSFIVYDKNGDEITIGLESIKDIAINRENILALSNKEKIGVVIIYSLNGQEIRRCIIPQNYTCYRFADVHDVKKIEVVLQGNEITKDQYGRNDWNFIFDIETNIWTLVGLSY